MTLISTSIVWNDLLIIIISDDGILCVSGWPLGYLEQDSWLWKLGGLLTKSEAAIKKLMKLKNETRWHMVKKVITAALIFIGVSAFAVYRLYNKAHRKIEDEVAIQVTANEIFQAYTTNENQSNERYLDKAVEVQGVIRERSKNQEGKTILILDTGDVFGGVACTMDEADGQYAKDDSVTIKGICKGFLTDVIVTQGKRTQ